MCGISSVHLCKTYTFKNKPTLHLTCEIFPDSLAPMDLSFQVLLQLLRLSTILSFLLWKSSDHIFCHSFVGASVYSSKIKLWKLQVPMNIFLVSLPFYLGYLLFFYHAKVKILLQSCQLTFSFVTASTMENYFFLEI